MTHAPVMTFEQRVRELAAKARDLQTITAIRDIADRVSQHTGIPADDILGSRRTAHIVEARHLVMFEAHQSGLAYNAIARAMGRDHATVMNGVHREGMRRRGVAA